MAPPASSSPRQTLSYLRNLFSAYGIEPKSKLGQNFLIDLNLLDLIVRAAELSKDDLVLEIGTGTGSLTARLAAEAGSVVSIEIDPKFHQLGVEALSGLPNVRLLRADVLKNKNQLNPEVLQVLQEARAQDGTQHLKLIANLPYAVAVPVISGLLLADLGIERMVVMVQAEIADRLLAVPGTKDYGALAVLVQSLASVEPVRRRVPPAVFWPRPQVASAILLIRPDPAKRAHVGDPAQFRVFLRDLYTHRRKNLRGALAGMPSRDWEKAEVDRRLAALGFDGTLRAEDLDVEQHLKLCASFWKLDREPTSNESRDSPD